MARCEVCNSEHPADAYVVGYFVEGGALVTVRGEAKALAYARETGQPVHWDKAFAGSILESGSLEEALEAHAQERLGLSDADFRAWAGGALADLTPGQQIRWMRDRTRSGE